MRRRDLLLSAAASLVPLPALAAPQPFTLDLWPPLTDRQAYVDWMAANRGGDRNTPARVSIATRCCYIQRPLDATRTSAPSCSPRAKTSCCPEDHDNAYVGHYLDIGFGVTITPPGTMGRMTSSITVKPTDKVLEIGTGSGYQSALLSYLTPARLLHRDHPRPRPPHARDLRSADRQGLLRVQRHHHPLRRRLLWLARSRPFDKIIVTCGIDHIPPPLLQQLKPNGLMVIPVGPPGAQHILKVTKRTAADGTVTVERSDIFGGKIIPFVR